MTDNSFLQACCDDISSTLGTIQSSIRKISTIIDKDQYSKKTTIIHNLLKECAASIQIFEQEVKENAISSQQRKLFTKQVENFTMQYQALKQELNTMKQPSAKEPPLNAKSTIPAATEFSNTITAKRRGQHCEKVKEVHQVQNSSISVLQNIIQLNESTLRIGNETTNKLQDQTRNMIQTHSKLQQLK